MAPTAKGSLAAVPREALIAWFRPRASAYPWRRPGPDPYAVLVSEIMLQQTQAPRVALAFEPFLDRFPTVVALAAASRADVLRAWAGLGYNRRAVSLHETARVIVRVHHGRVPGDVGTLSSLPGVGPYTAAAVASLAFGVPVAAVDSNVRRVIARVSHGAAPDELTSREVSDTAAEWLEVSDPGRWNSALMDLGRHTCRPRAPRCDECPLARACSFRELGRPAAPPRRRQRAFEGSFRQLRGAIVRVLRDRERCTPRELARLTGSDDERVRRAIGALSRDGLVEWANRSSVRLAR